MCLRESYALHRHMGKYCRVYIYIYMFAGSVCHNKQRYSESVISKEKEDGQPHASPQDGFPSGFCWVVDGLDSVANQDLSTNLDTKT